MKRFLLSCILGGLLGGVALAAPWGVLYDYAPASHDKNESVNPAYLLQKVLRGEPLRIGVYGGSKDHGTYIAAAYNAWFENAAHLIKEQGREAEFADLLPLLEQGVKTELFFHKEIDNPDLWVKIVNKSAISDFCNSSMTVACYNADDLPATVYVPQQEQGSLFYRGVSKKEFMRILVHEFGHSLGLADQYRQGRSNAHWRYSTPQSDKGVMNRSKKLSCDDADGLINLIDLTRGVARGGAQGWDSLCRPAKYRYVRAMPVLKGPYFIEELEDHADMLRLTIWDGAQEQVKDLPLAEESYWPVLNPPPVQVQRTDAHGRPLYARGPKGEEIFYAYHYESDSQLVVDAKGQVQMWYLSMKYMGTTFKQIRFQQGHVRHLLELSGHGRQAKVLYQAEQKFRAEGYFHGKRKEPSFTINVYGSQPPAPRQVSAGSLHADGGIARQLTQAAQTQEAQQQVLGLRRQLQRAYELYW